jgi:hypothetical protein
MKMHTWILSALAAATLVLSGCSKSDDHAGHAHANVDPAPIEKSFASAEPALKATADKAVAAIKGADYSAATSELQKLAANVKLTDDQKKAISDVLAQVQKAVTEAGTKAAGEAGKAVEGIQNSLGK